MQYYGVVVHHSSCPAINGKGFDFYITRDGTIIPSSELTDPLYIHICLEGDFHALNEEEFPDLEQREQLFLLSKLVYRLSQTFGFSTKDIFPHTNTCPGSRFPWSQLVISGKDRYH